MEKTNNIPDGVDVHVHGMQIKVKGKHGELSRDFADPRFIHLVKIEKDGNLVRVSGATDIKKVNAIVGTINAHVKNMIIGVTTGYKYEMKILYTHFPISVAQNGKEIQIKNFFGEKSTRTAKIAGDAEVKIDKDIITITGNNVEEVGQTAGNIEGACKLRGRDRRVFQDGIYLSERKLKTGENV